MKKTILFFTLFLGLSQLSQAQFDVLKQKAEAAKNKVLGGGGLSSEEIGKGLKEALEVGISKGSDALAQKGGYLNSVYKIMLPPEARAVSDKLKAVPGFNKVEADMIEKLNAAAEDAATKAKPIFVKAITAMTFADALNILMGEKNAATLYLKKATMEALYKEFNPIIVASLDKFGARKYWGDATAAHNKLPFVKKANPDLDDYVTRSALDGLFGMVEVKEKDIRQNTGSRTTDLLKKVFGEQDKK